MRHAGVAACARHHQRDDLDALTRCLQKLRELSLLLPSRGASYDRGASADGSVVMDCSAGISSSTRESVEVDRSDAQAARDSGPDDQISRSASLVAVVEDDDDIRAAVADLLGEEGHHVLQYASAAQALRDMQLGRRPDLIVLDLMMPGMNGWQFRVEQLRQAELADIPVIVLSADASAYAAAIDADAYLKKPIDADRLCAVVGHVLLATERRRLATKAIELERMRSLGMLVASVAHEINNPLTYVTGHIELALLRARELGACHAASNTPTRQFVTHMESALDGVQRIAHIVRLLSTFTRADHGETQYADVLRAVDAASRLAMHQLARRARLACHLTPLPLVRVSEAQLAQVFLNLLVNAAHAIPEGAADRHEVRVSGRVQDGMVIVEVADDGCGIAPELTHRIFEPFYTTKPFGLGMGLGLSISRDIVSSVGGSIAVSSTLGQGTTFHIELPIASP
jgi:signal transduction histidine kinase